MTQQATTKDIENLLNEDYKETMTQQIKATNPYSGESAMLTQDEHKLYIEIKEAERDEEYNTMQKGLDKFSRLNAKAYMILLD